MRFSVVLANISHDLSKLSLFTMAVKHQRSDSLAHGNELCTESLMEKSAALLNGTAPLRRQLIYLEAVCVPGWQDRLFQKALAPVHSQLSIEGTDKNRWTGWQKSFHEH